VTQRSDAPPPAPAPAEESAAGAEANARASNGAGRGSAESVARLTPAARLTRAMRVRRVPRAAWVCALVACLNAVCWSILTPPFQVPDEPDHFAYVKQLAETGHLPSANAEESEEENTALLALHYAKIRQQPQNHTIATQAEQEALERALANSPHETGSAGAGVATSEPPLYYALEAIPYSVAVKGTVLDRLALMRLTSALFAGLTAMFVFLFIRETLPAAAWSWTVGGLSVALTPLLGFMSGGVNPDSMLFAVSAAAFYCVARAFRRGLSTRGALAIGAVIAIGLSTKLNFIGLVPGILLGAVAVVLRAAWRSRRAAWRSRRAALLALALVVTIAFIPAIAYAVSNAASARPAFGIVSTAQAVHGSLLSELNYIWQLYLPRLPGTVNDFPGLSTPRQVWFDGFVGLYGWLDTTFPGWVYSAALVPAGAIALLCARSLWQARDKLRGRAVELAVYAVMVVGLMALVGAASFSVFPETDAEYGQMRYLLPLLALLGAALALAARGAGRRWGPAVGTLIVILFFAHDVFSQLQVVARYYG
jgi:4-amino-4-deoxy-L-arabinose transferase-like glycosyltransferase